MQCPYCGCDMEKGSLQSRGGLFFLPDGEQSPKLYTHAEMEKHRAIYLPPYWLDRSAEYPIAHVCRSCNKLILEY